MRRKILNLATSQLCKCCCTCCIFPYSCKFLRPNAYMHLYLGVSTCMHSYIHYLCIHVYMCMYVSMYSYIHVLIYSSQLCKCCCTWHIFSYSYKFLRPNAYMHLYLGVSTCMHTYHHVYACIYVLMYTCVCMCLRIHIFMYVSICKFSVVFIKSFPQKPISVRVWMHACCYMCNMDPCMYVCMHVCMHAAICPNVYPFA